MNDDQNITIEKAQERMEALRSACHKELSQSLESLNFLWQSGQRIQAIADESKALASKWGLENAVLFEVVTWRNEAATSYPPNVKTHFNELLIKFVRILFSPKEAR